MEWNKLPNVRGVPWPRRPKIPTSFLRKPRWLIPSGQNPHARLQNINPDHWSRGMRTGLGVHTLASPNFAGQKRSTKFMGVDIYRVYVYSKERQRTVPWANNRGSVWWILRTITSSDCEYTYSCTSLVWRWCLHATTKSNRKIKMKSTNSIKIDMHKGCSRAV